MCSSDLLNAVRAEVLPGTDFLHPVSVLSALNRAFPMERHEEMYFTIWYGVYDRRTRLLRWSGGGHPPPLLFTPGHRDPQALGSDGPIVGAIEGVGFAENETAVPAGSRLYIYSDGAFEIVKPDGGMSPFEDFRAFLRGLWAGGGEGRPQPPDGGGGALDAFLAHARAISGGRGFVDDLSIVGIDFP